VKTAKKTPDAGTVKKPAKNVPLHLTEREAEVLLRVIFLHHTRRASTLGEEGKLITDVSSRLTNSLAKAVGVPPLPPM